MKETGHHLLSWMHNEVATAGHWFNTHLAHDRHFWLYLLVALAAIAIFAAVLLFGSSVQVQPEFRFYPYLYGTM
jgi:hypothetical protein